MLKVFFGGLTQFREGLWERPYCEAEPDIVVNLCQMLELPYPSERTLIYAVNAVTDGMMRTGLNSAGWAIVPQGFTVEHFVMFIKLYNEALAEEGLEPFKMSAIYDAEPFNRFVKSASSDLLPTEFGAIHCPTGSVMYPEDPSGRPFNLNYGEKLKWAEERGDSGIMSMAEVLYCLFLRPLLCWNRISFHKAHFICRDEWCNREASGRYLVHYSVGGGLDLICAEDSPKRLNYDQLAVPRVFRSVPFESK